MGQQVFVYIGCSGTKSGRYTQLNTVLKHAVLWRKVLGLVIGFPRVLAVSIYVQLIHAPLALIEHSTVEIWMTLKVKVIMA